MRRNDRQLLDGGEQLQRDPLVARLGVKEPIGR
jgi:hypothetical protein